jgi:hypothetical protein
MVTAVILPLGTVCIERSRLAKTALKVERWGILGMITAVPPLWALSGQGAMARMCSKSLARSTNAFLSAALMLCSCKKIAMLGFAL